MIARVKPFVCALLLWWSPPGTAIPAFNGAEGFGSETHHARGAIVCRVTQTTDDSNATKSYLAMPGEFRFCLLKAKEFSGAYIVFDVSGTITLKTPVRIPSNVYIAGQTSPGGIAFAGNAIVLKDSSDVVIRHIRHREAARKGDAFTIDNSSDVVLDHVSVSFFKDGAVDIVNNAHDITIQWSHMGDAIDSGSKKERYHGQPNLLRNGVDRVSLHHNFYTHGHSRMPLAHHTVGQPHFLIEFSNNVIYNYGKYPSRFAAVEGLGNVIGNFYIPGRNTHSDLAANVTSDRVPKNPVDIGGRQTKTLSEDLDISDALKPPVLIENGMSLYVKGNLMIDGFGHDATIYTDKYGKQIELGVPGLVTGVRPVDSIPDERIVKSGSGKVIAEAAPFRPLRASVVGIPIITTVPARENLPRVLESFGALPRDNTDKRLVEELRSRSGRWKYMKPQDNNVYAGHPPADSDSDGLPDYFEDKVGRDIKPTGHDFDGTLDNIEIYLDELADTLLKATPAINIDN